MAAQYTEISGTEMEVFLKRAFRALRPEKGMQNKEIFYDLKFSPTVVIRVWTSIRPWGASAGAGEDAIRVQFFGSRVNRPLVSGKAPIVKRTQNWRNSLQDKIEDYLELYEDKAEYWDERGGADPGSKGPPASDKQIRFLMSMASKASEEQWANTDLKWPVDENELKALTSKEANKLIETLLSQGLGNRRYATEVLGEVDVRAVLREQVRASLRGDLFQDRGACDGACGKTECTCGGSCTGNCTCGKKDPPVVAKVTAISTWKSNSSDFDEVIASILDDSSV
jgi:hypothetical protein